MSGCNLTPIHASNSSFNQSLASLAIETSHNRAGQLFEQTLSSTINHQGKKSPTTHKLKILINTDEHSLAIQSDRTVTRFRTIVTAQYQLLDTQNDTVIRQGVLKRENGYDKTDSEYATYIAQQQSIEDAITALARDFQPLLVSSLQQ